MTMKKAKPSARQGSAETARGTGSESYAAAIRQFEAALALFQKGHLQEALAGFRKLEAASGDEYRLAEQSRTYAAICERRLAPAAPVPIAPEDLYRAAVGLANGGHFEEAEGLLGRAIEQRPADPTFYYARAAVHAQKGSAERAARDLGRAIELNPQLRHQATNDTDFEKVRDEAVFIDVIEPTPTGG